MTDYSRIALASQSRPSLRKLIEQGELLQLPVAHDALTARLIHLAGFKAYQIGGFALAGTRYAFPDIGLIHFYEENEALRQVIVASPLPVIVDAADGFGDAKNVIRTVRGYEELGVTGIFIEDQKAPVSCGQMGRKEIVSIRNMVGKIQAAVDARSNEDTFIIARTDGRSAVDVDEAIKRAKAYRKAGADGIYVEGLRSAKELKKIGKELRGIPLATTLMEGGGKLPWLPPDEIAMYGFQLIMYPTTLLFQLTYSLQQSLKRLKNGMPMPVEQAVNLEEFEQIVGLPAWQELEKKYRHQ